MNSVKIGNYQMDTAFGLYLPEYTIPAPAPQTKFIDIIGRDGALDLSNAFGEIHFKSRDWTLDFKCFNPAVNWLALSSTVMNAIHGKRLNFTFDDDPNWYWTGRVMVQNYTSKKGEGTLRIKITSDPYKYANLTHIVTSAVPVGEETFTAALVSIDNDQLYRPVSLSVPVPPVQDLHGYASPWGPGGGKNIANYADCVTAAAATTEVTILDSQNGFNVKTKTTGIYRSGQIENMTFSAGVTYTLSADVEITSGTAAIAFRKKSSSALISYSGAITENGHYSVSHTFTATDADDCRLSFFATYMTSEDGDVTFSNVMLEVGSTATSFAPYENVCTISGRTSLSAYRTGKNLCKIGVINGRVSNGITFTENADGSVHCKGTASAESFSAGGVAYSSRDARCMYVLPAGTYTVSNISGVRIYVNYYNSELVSFGNAAYVQVGSSVTNTFNEPVIIYIRISVSSGKSVDTDSYIMVTEGSTAATEYEPWQMKTVTDDWTSAAGTVYGGTLDVVSGVLTVDMGNIPSYNGETINEPWLSSMDAFAAGTTPTTGAQVVYPLANPIEYQLTPSKIKLLAGQNNIWASNGAIITADVVKPVNVENTGSKSVVPSVTASSDMTLSWNDFSYSMQAGTSVIPKLSLNHGDNYVYVDGTGTISFEFREGSL